MVLAVLMMSLAWYEHAGGKKVEYQEEGKKSKYCKNFINLVTAHDSIPYFDINLEYSCAYIFEQLEEELDTEICIRGVAYKDYLNLDDGSFSDSGTPVRFTTSRMCKADIYCGILNRYQILINSNNQILAQNDFTILDSITPRVSNYFTEFVNHERLGLRCVALSWHHECDPGFFFEVMNSIIEGYHKSVSAYAIQNFNADLCQLNQKQIQIIKTDIPFEFELELIPFIELPTTPPDAYFKSDMNN